MATARRRNMGLLGVLLLVGLVVVLLMITGIIDLDVNADVTGPDVQVEPGQLPEVDVQPAEPADAGG